MSGTGLLVGYGKWLRTEDAVVCCNPLPETAPSTPLIASFGLLP